MDYNNTWTDRKDEDEGVLDTKVVEYLKVKVKLDNGEDGYVFTKNTDDNPRGRYQCHVCNVPICSTKSLMEHATGKNHTRKMKNSFHAHETFSKIVLKENPKLATDVGGKVVSAPGVDIPDLAPGEPVPPGFEDIVTRVPEITSTLDEMKAPLIGLEYLAEIPPTGDEIEPRYYCLFCSKRGDPRTVLAHLVSFNHRIKYIGKYFPRTNNALALVPKVKEYKRGTGEVLARIVKAIENKFGRLSPVIVDAATFDDRKEEYYKEISAGRHFHETNDSNYESLVDLEFIKKCAPDGNLDNVLTIDMEIEEAKRKSTALKNEMNFKNKHKQVIQDQQQQIMQLQQQHIKRNQTQFKKSNEKEKHVPARELKRKREKSIETISTISSKSRSLSRSRSRSYSRSWSRSRSRSRNRHSHSNSRSRSGYKYMYRDYKRDEGRRRSPRYRRSRSRSRSRGNNYRTERRFRTERLPYRNRSPVPIRQSFRTIRYDSLYNDEDGYPASERPKSTQSKVAELRDKRKKWDLYRDFSSKLEEDMAKTLKGYEKNPEKHPLYPEEWKKFWNRRYRELTSEGIDASKHDFKPEWIEFWAVRVEELHNEELKTKKNKYRTELGLPEESPGRIDSDVIEVSPTPLEDDKASVTVDDIRNTWKAMTGSEIRGGSEAKKARSKTPDQTDNYEIGTVKIDPDQPIRVIGVLRLLTALESQLGSLGPRVNNLLSQAIALEKKAENSSDTLIEVSENNVLFETVKEKLKGQLFAGIVEKHMVNATRVAIQNVAELFNSWKAKKNNPEPVPVPAAVPVAASAVAVTLPTPVLAPIVPPNVTPVLSNPAPEPLIVPGVGAVDKIAIAQQIASALIAQGKTNVTEQELEQLINAVVGMAQANSSIEQPKPVANSMTAPPAQQAHAPVTSSGIELSLTSQPSQVYTRPQIEEPEQKLKLSSLQSLMSQVTKSSMDANSSLKLLQAYDEPVRTTKKFTSKEMAELTEEDMKTLLQNFKDLSAEEQQCLITYLKELESKDPDGVEKLRKFVNLSNENTGKSEVKHKEESQGRLSPFSMREGGANPFIDDGSKARELDEDEDDYSYEDIYKAAEKKIAGRSVVEQIIEEQEQSKDCNLTPSKREGSIPMMPIPDIRPSFDMSTKSVNDDPEGVLSEAKLMIANIMGQLPTKFTGGSTRTTMTANVKTAPSLPPRATSATDTHPTPMLSMQSAYENPNANSPSKTTDNNLLNDYNYQDDLFGYSNDGFQNYMTGNYNCESNSNESFNQRQSHYSYNKNSEPGFNNYNGGWNDHYSHQQQYQQQSHPQNNFECPPQGPMPVHQQNFNNRPQGGYQMQQNDFNRQVPQYHNNYRDYY